MSHSQTVQFGILCLQTLHQESTKSLPDIIHESGIPLLECRTVLEAFESAGIVSQDAQGGFRLERAIESLNALEVLQALWYAPARLPTFRLLYAANPGAGARSCRKASAFQILPSDGGAS